MFACCRCWSSFALALAALVLAAVVSFSPSCCSSSVVAGSAAAGAAPVVVVVAGAAVVVAAGAAAAPAGDGCVGRPFPCCGGGTDDMIAAMGKASFDEGKLSGKSVRGFWMVCSSEPTDGET